jgi:hypothetical protein
LSWNDDSRTVLLPAIYPDRTFRFCFTNRQMVTAVTRFLWGQPELRPDSDPAYIVQWTDDSYSQDLSAGCMRVLDHRAADNYLQQWGFVTGAVGLGLHPATLAGWITSGFRHEASARLDVDSSVGSFAAPNPYEAKVVRDLLAQMESARSDGTTRPAPRRPLLVLTGQQQPSRRLLRDLARSAPDTARRFVVIMGDAISFNTIYRDRQVAWPIQDLPFTLIFFAHRNPIDSSAGFRPIGESPGGGSPTEASGTEDLLLYRDIVEALSLAYRGTTTPSEDATDLASGLRAVRNAGGRLTMGREGPTLFGSNGQRATGTGEHVVYLRPRFRGDRVLPRAIIEVWERQGDRSWQRRDPVLRVSFDEFEVHHGDGFPGS